MLKCSYIWTFYMINIFEIVIFIIISNIKFNIYAWFKINRLHFYCFVTYIVIFTNISSNLSIDTFFDIAVVNFLCFACFDSNNKFWNALVLKTQANFCKCQWRVRKIEFFNCIYLSTAYLLSLHLKCFMFF